MIRKILTTYAMLLEEHLSRFHNRPEGLATMEQIGNGTEEKLGKMVVSLLNLNVMLAAVFDERQYAEF